VKSGSELAADIVVTATGLQLNVLGDMAISRRRPCASNPRSAGLQGHDAQRCAEPGYTFGYTNASGR
jgi:monooxygenase